ncbi:hypothetical protein TSUD_348380 [Trifolium subterraneum]|nr:hypothetical protein TSUD_348380 [Trifolium subterraneum]
MHTSSPKLKVPTRTTPLPNLETLTLSLSDLPQICRYAPSMTTLICVYSLRCITGLGGYDEFLDFGV